MAFVLRGLAYALDDLAGEFVEAVHAGLGVADDDEFVAARPRDEIAVTQISLNRLRRVDQHRVPGRMAERVVDLLEAVEIDVKQHHAAAGRRAARRALLQRALHVHAIRQRVRKSCRELYSMRARAASSSALRASVSALERVRSSVSATSAVTSQLTPTIFEDLSGKT